MGTPLLHVGSVVSCPHGVPSQVVVASPRVRVAGMPAATLSDTWTIAGCPFTLPSGTPSPCVSIRWMVPATRVRIGGNPALLQSSAGLCLAATQAPQGPPIVSSVQPRVSGL